MKIEKINENQIRCTLTKEDLASRQLKISELAYGTEKAKSLFRDMMQQANFEFGFEAEDIPLMIEAVPVNGECIVLIITKVEDPEELDTRFSRFAPSAHEEDDTQDGETMEASDDILDLFRKIQAEEADTDCESKETTVIDTVIRLFRFDTLRPLLSLSAHLPADSLPDSILFHDTKTGHYLLQITGQQADLSQFNKLCNMLSEYGTPKRVLPATVAYLSEHCETVINDHALEALARLNMQ